MLAVALGDLAACCDNLQPTSQIIGNVWSDDNGNGLRDPDEAGFGGVVVYVELDGDSSINGTDPVTRTAADGSYVLEVPGPGTYQVHEVLPFGVRARAHERKRVVGTHHIIGGADAGPDDYRFMVAVGQPFGDRLFPFCGGALITDRHVVTAGHCSQGIGPDRVAVAAGTLDPFDPQAGGMVVDVASIAIHPSFRGAEAGNDIAIWTLAAPIDLEASGLHTVELVTAETAALVAPGTLATTIGWGVSDRDSPLLQQVHVPIVDAASCAAAYPDSEHLDTQLCAGSRLGGIDSCQGDSGGPLLVRDPVRQVWVQAGITSYGEGCALPDFPGVYSRVSALAEWAQQQASETSEPIEVTIEAAGEHGIADFANETAVRPQVGEIAPRWQLTGTTLPSQVAPDSSITVDFALLADDPSLEGFTCSFAGDLAAGTAAQPVPCTLGDNELVLPGFPTGIFATALVAARDGVTLQRRVDLIAGSPPSTPTAGALEAQDPLDPDYTDPYHLDYFDIGALTGSKAFAIEASSTNFGMFLTLYDADARDFDNGGGILAFGESTASGTSRIVVVPEAGKHYLVGVSSFEVFALGTYQVSIVNDGALTARP